jgi:N-acetylglucosaminyl-diphospho-decaprenol L-rhamnosyltransferase
LTPQAEVPERQTPRISVVIVSFNRADQLRENLKAIGTDHQIVVVDNGSWDGAETLSEEFPNLRFSRLPKNFGLTKALNIGLRSAEGEYILCLHDDVRISSEVLTRMADFLEARPDVGAVCPLLTDEAGNPLPQLRALPTPSDPDPELRAPPIGEKSAAEKSDAEITVECVSGAAFMFRSFFLRALRQVDERYGTYGSSIELCAQMRRAAKKVVILHSVTAIHENAASPVPRSALEGDRAAGTAAFLGKHHGLASALVYRLKTALGALFTFRFAVVVSALSGQKIDGTG